MADKCIHGKDVPIDALRERFSYDPSTGVVTNRHTGGPSGASSKGGYITTNVNFDGRSCHLRVHRLAWALFHGEWPTAEIDHINRDPADNRIANLRLSTRRQQAQNTNKRLPNGVWFQPQASFERPFEARVWTGAGYRYLGRSETIMGARALVVAFEQSSSDSVAA